MLSWIVTRGTLSY